MQSLDSYCGDAPDEQAFYVSRTEDGNITNICGGSFVGSTVKPYRMAAGGVNHVCSGLPGGDSGIKQGSIRMQQTVRFDNTTYLSADNRVVRPSRPA